MPATEVDLINYRTFTLCQLNMFKAIVLLHGGSTPRNLQRVAAMPSAAPAFRHVLALSCHTIAAKMSPRLGHAATSVRQTSAKEKYSGAAS